MRLAFAWTLLVSLVYEPLRWLLTLNPSLQTPLGGVGGVGGLTNQDLPSANCSTTAENDAYCFTPGLILGFTPFALVVLAIWVLPLALGAMAIAAKKTGAVLTVTDAAEPSLGPRWAPGP